MSIRGSIYRKSFAPDRLHATRIETFVSPTIDKVSHKAKDAVDVLESTETVCAMRYDDMKTVGKSLCHCVAV